MAVDQIDVSVIVPVFNCAQYLETLIGSLQAQKDVRLEIIAVDDGSSDDSLAILERLAVQEPRLQVVSQPNLGVSAARNRGLELARGRWVAFADGDDWVAPDALAAWVKLGDARSLELVLGNGFRFEADPEQHPRVGLAKWLPASSAMSGEEWVVGSVARDAWHHYVWLQLIRREVLFSGNLRFVENIVHEDVLWSAHLAKQVQRLAVCPTPFYGYRTRPGSIMGCPSQRAVIKRARSYLIVLSSLVALAHAPDCSPRMRQALLRQANVEAGHWLGLIRKKIADPSRRAVLIRQYRRLRLARHVFAGATSKSEYWLAMRAWWLTSVRGRSPGT
jgi:glycosyltransferase involved in cell wall biosynthesis